MPDLQSGSACALVSAELRRWIRDATGVQITDANAAPVALALRIQAERAHLEPTELRQRLIEGSSAAQAFIDEITTHESYFFRAREQMQLVVEQIIPQRLRRAPGRPVRVLSLPCARGEEPYSLAILLEEAGIAANAVEITGADIAHSCIEAARIGAYSALALRRTDQQRARHWFRRGAGPDLQLDQSILRRVSFRRVNLLRDAERLLHGPFDIVFCENLLIYFDAANVARALGVVERLLSNDGWLFVDHAEWNLPRARFRMQEWQGRVGFRPQAAGIGESSTPASTAADGRSTARVPAADARQVEDQTRPGRSVADRATSAELAGQAHPTRAPSPPHHTRPSSPATRHRETLARAGTRRTTPTRAALAASPQGWRQTLTQAQTSYETKRFTEALLGFETVLRRHPDQPEALLGKARVLADCGEDFEAMEVLEQLVTTDVEDTGTRALTDNPSVDKVRAEALGLMAVLLHKKGLEDLAAQYLRRLAMLDPKHLSLALLGHRSNG